MPCYDDRTTDPKYICAAVQERADAATRAACEMAKLIRQDFFYKLSSRTRQWIRNHEDSDKKAGR